MAWLIVSAWGVVAAETPKPAILSVTRPETGWGPGANETLIARPLVEAGFTIDVCFENEIPKFLATGKYSVLVWAPMWDPTYPPEGEQFRKDFPPIQKAVNDFLAKGGGLLVLGAYNQPALLSSVELTKPWGARQLPEKTVDAAGEVDFHVKWARTTQVSGPAAPGVRAIWFPTGSNEIGKWWWPLDLDKNWTVVLRGEKTTTSAFAHWMTDVDKLRRENPAAEGVPLAAIRDLKPGRVAIVGLPHSYSFMAGVWPGADAFLYEGLDGKPSDGRKMLFNLLTWLAEPAVKAGLVGATTPDKVLKPFSPMEPGTPPAVNWAVEFSTPSRPFRGLAGARTKLSGGKSTVAEYAKAAREAKVDFLIFLEDHKLMTPEKNEQLRKECRAVSDAKFQAIPGFTIEDEFRNHWFIAGDKAVYPSDLHLSADKKNLAANYGKGDARAKTPGTMMCDLALGFYQAHVLVGSWRHKENAMPPWDFRDHSAAALVTTDESGAKADEIFTEYLKLQQNGNLLMPYALEMMNSADQVAARAEKGWMNCVWGPALEAVAAKIPTIRGSHADQYITNGPEIVDWQTHPRYYPSLIGDRCRPDLFRMRVHLAVKSKTGLKEVCVYDGERRLRRFLPGGEMSFRREFELFNIPQQNLLLTVTDTEGRRAVSSAIETRCGDFVEFMCSDRNNHIFNGAGVRADGTVFREAPPTGNGATPDKGGANWLITPCFPHAYDFRTPCCPWDGGRWPPGSCMRFNPAILVSGEPEKPLHNTPRRSLHSQDVMIGEAVIDGAYPDKFREMIGMVWESIYPVEPSRYLEGNMRLTYWKTRPDSYTATFFEETLRFKKEVTLTGDRGVIVGTMSGGAKTHYLIKEATGEIHTGLASDVKTPLIGDMDGRGYVSFFDENTNASFFSMTPGLRFELVGPYVRLSFTPPSKTIAAGTEFKVKILGVGTPLVRDPDGAKKADEAFGINTGKPAYTVKLDRGKIASQRYVLALTAEGGGAAGMIPKKELPAYLPVTVSGLNPNWCVVCLDRATGKWRPTGEQDGTAYVLLDPTARDESFYVGHIATCDQPELCLQVSQVRPSRWTVEAHNPTDREISATISFVKDFAPLASCAPIPVKVAPGQSETIPLDLSSPATNP